MADDRKPKEQQGLPEGWKRISLGDKDYFKIVGSGIEYFKGFKNYLSTNSVQGTKITHIEDVITYKNRPSRANMQPKKGRLAFARMRNTVKVLLIDENLEKDYILSTGFVLLESKIEPKFVYQYLISDFFNTQKDILAEGTTQEAISNDDFNRIFIIFPENKLEQRKIAEILETVDNAIEKTEKIIEKYKRIKQGLMQDLLTKGIDENGNIRSEKTHKFKDSPLGRIPEEWEVVRLGEVGEIISGSTPSTYNSEYWNGEIVWITPEDLSKTKTLFIENSSRKITQKGLRSCSARIIPAYSVVISSRAPIGYVKVSKVPFTTSQGCKSIAYNGKFSPEFLAIMLSNKVQDMINLGSGTTFQEITKSNLKNLLIPLPPLSEQKRIAEILSQIDQAIEKEEKYKEKLERLKKGLMEDLLTGKVRVNKLLEGENHEMA
jgi:type I restriction enzyme S subunit